MRGLGLLQLVRKGGGGRRGDVGSAQIKGQAQDRSASGSIGVSELGGGAGRARSESKLKIFGNFASGVQWSRSAGVLGVG